jgi:very-short-patch-repair endonuclease
MSGTTSYREIPIGPRVCVDVPEIMNRPTGRPLPNWGQVNRRMNVSERMIFSILKKLGVRVIPSVVIERWEVDFLLPDQSAIVEVDGPSYHTRSDATRRDRAQDARFHELGFVPIHCWTTDLHTEGGEDKILKHVVERLYRERGVILPIRRLRRFARYYRDLGMKDD